MIQLSTKLAEVLAMDVIETFLMVQVKSKSGDIKYNTTTYFSNITLSDGREYLGDGSLVSVDPPQISSSVDREQYKVTLADPDFDAGSTLDTLLGHKAEVRAGFVDSVTGYPLLNLEDTLIIYAGDIDQAAISANVGEHGEVLLQLTCASPMGDLDLKKQIYLSKDEVRKRDINDTCCDQIYVGSGKFLLKWGKE